MSYVPKESLAVVAKDALVSGELGRPKPAVAAALESVERGRTLLEVHRRLRRELADETPEEFSAWVETLERECDVVSVVPLPRRFHYAWVAVAMAAGNGEGEGLAEVLTNALARTDESGSGLLLSDLPLGELPEHVEWMGPDTAPAFRGNPAALLQLARFVLRSYPATRVLCCEGSSAAVLADVAERHSLGVVVEPDSNGLEEAGSTPGAGELLQSIARGENAADATGWARGANTWLCLGEASALRERRITSSVLGWSSSSAASFLSPERIAGSLERPDRVESNRKDTAEPSLEVSEREPRVSPARTGRRVAFASLHLLGDTLAATAVLRAHRRAHPEDHLSFLAADTAFARIVELCPGIDRVAYLRGTNDDQIIFRSSRELVESLPWWVEGDFEERHVLDIQEAASASRGEDLHMAEIYAERLGLKLEDRRPWIDADRAAEHRPAEAPEEPYVVFARHTVSGKHVSPSHPRTKRWHENKWARLAERIRRRLGLRAVSIGTPSEGRMEHPDVLDLHELDIREVAGLLVGARALVCVDNGVFHLGQGLETTLVHLQPKWLPSRWTASASQGPFRDLRASLPSLGVDPVLAAVEEMLAEDHDPATPASGQRPVPS